MNNACPQCGSKAYKRNGYTRHGKQNHRCLDCGRQFSLMPELENLPGEKVQMVQNILKEEKAPAVEQLV